MLLLTRKARQVRVVCLTLPVDPEHVFRSRVGGSAVIDAHAAAGHGF